jgi:hypothetical protein
MAFGINDKEVEVAQAPTTGFGVNDVVVQKTTATVEKPPEDLTKAAFGIAPRQRAGALQERAANIRKEEAEKIPFDALWKDDKNFKTIQDYAAARFGKEGVPLANESKQDFVNRFATHMRMLDTGNEWNSVGELQYLNNAKREDILKAGAAYDLFKNTAGVFDEQNRGQKGIRPVMDVLSSIISSPSTALTLGTGKIVSSGLTKLAAEKGTKAALTSAKGFGMAAATPAVGGVTTAAQDVTAQKIELNVTQAEFDQAMSAIGVNKLYELDLATDQLGDYSEVALRTQLIRVIREFKPYLTITFDPDSYLYEDNEDHKLVAKAMAEANWAAGFDKHPNSGDKQLPPHLPVARWYFGRQVAKPTHYFDVTKHLGKAISAAKLHKTMLNNMARQLELKLQSMEDDSNIKLDLSDQLDKFATKIMKNRRINQVKSVEYAEIFRVIDDSKLILKLANTRER